MELFRRPPSDQMVRQCTAQVRGWSEAFGSKDPRITLWTPYDLRAAQGIAFVDAYTHPEQSIVTIAAIQAAHIALGDFTAYPTVASMHRALSDYEHEILPHIPQNYARYRTEPEAQWAKIFMAHADSYNLVSAPTVTLTETPACVLPVVAVHVSPESLHSALISEGREQFGPMIRALFNRSLAR